MNKFKKQLLPVYTFAKIDTRRLFRDRVAIFFTFVFPLIFLFIFGGIFGKDSDVSFKVAVINQSQTESARIASEQISNNKVFEVQNDVTSVEAAQTKMQRSEVDATIILPSNFGEVKDGKPSGEAIVLYDRSNEQGAQTLASILNGTFEELNNKIAPTVTPFTVKTESTATEAASNFDYTFAGLLGFTIISLGIFGPTSVFPRLKQRGVLRRYQTTTLKVWQYFLGNVISTAFVGILSVATMFVVALTVFDLNMRGDYISLLALVIIGTIVLFGIGLAVGGWAKNENQAAPLANLIAFPMFFLGGTFFPRYLMPDWLQQVSSVIPITPLNDGVRMIVTEGKTIFDLGPQVGLLALWALVIYFIAFRVFRWE